jgi:hypothetical protein
MTDDSNVRTTRSENIHPDSEAGKAGERPASDELTRLIGQDELFNRSDLLFRSNRISLVISIVCCGLSDDVPARRWGLGLRATRRMGFAAGSSSPLLPLRRGDAGAFKRAWVHGCATGQTRVVSLVMV